MAPAVFAYWDIRGLAQPIRLLLEYSGIPWEDKLYSCGPPPTYDKSCWFDIKFSLGLDFPNLPYYIDDEVKLTQSKAIMRYIARKAKLDGMDEKEKIRIDLAEGEIEDFRSSFSSTCYNPDFENLKKVFLSNLAGKLEGFSKFLGNNQWLAGKNISFVDFSFYEILDQIKLLEPNCLKSFKNLEDYQLRFEKLDKISAYISSDRFIKYPLNNKMAKFGG